MAIIDDHTNKDIQIVSPSVDISEDFVQVSQVTRLLQGDTNLVALQLQAGDYIIKCDLQSFSAQKTLTMPGLHVSYSYATVEGTTTNTLTGKCYSVRDAEKVSSSVSFVTNGLGPVSVGLRGYNGNGPYSAAITIYKHKPKPKFVEPEDE